MTMGDDILGIAMLVLIFAAVVLGVLAIAPLFRPKLDLASRVSTMPASNLAAASTVSSGGATLRADTTQTIWARLVAEVESRGLSLDDEKAPLLKEKLAMAGYHQPYAVRAFVLARAVLALVFPVVAYIFVMVTDMALPTSKLYLTIVGAAAAGLYLPNYIVSSRGERNRTETLNGFPDALDLMLVCVEAGLGVDACFARVGQEIVNLHPRLARLFAGVSLELRAGRARADALKNMAKKSGVPEIQSFATLVIQSDKLGASIGQALKVYAGEMREARRMRAEEKAHRLPVLMSVPLVVFLLPTMIGVLGLPAAIQISQIGIGDK
jgi:tight adherence protein C